MTTNSIGHLGILIGIRSERGLGAVLRRLGNGGSCHCRQSRIDACAISDLPHRVQGHSSGGRDRGRHVARAVSEHVDMHREWQLRSLARSLNHAPALCL